MGTIITVLNGITQRHGAGKEGAERGRQASDSRWGCACLVITDNTYKSIASTRSATTKVNDITINIERFTFLRGVIS